jgi:hypothetical protein
MPLRNRFSAAPQLTPVVRVATMRRKCPEIEEDVLELARAFAEARGVTIGKALSELARRGITARTPILSRLGFPVFQVPLGSPAFGPNDVAAALHHEAIDD